MIFLRRRLFFSKLILKKLLIVSNMNFYSKWSNLEFTFEVGGSLVAADAMFLEPCHAVIHAKILTGINRENFAVKN